MKGCGKRNAGDAADLIFTVDHPTVFSQPVDWPFSVSATEWKPATPLEVSRMLTENFHGSRQPILPAGGCTSRRVGRDDAERPVILVTENLNSLIDYPARDMTVTVQAGMRVSELQTLLASEQQQLPIDIPQARQATIGGAIAANISGSSRFGYGTFRDYVIGVSAVDGQGRLFSAGGRVVKNVAGYDLCKLMIGSMGTLGVITQVTLKLIPKPHCRTFVLAGCPRASIVEAALSTLNLSSTRPVVMDLLNAKTIRQLQSDMGQQLPEEPDVLCIGYAGGTDETNWQMATVAGELLSSQTSQPQMIGGQAAENLWQGLTEYQSASTAPFIFRAALLPSRIASFVELCSQHSVAVQAHAGSGIVIGQLPDGCTDSQAARQLLRTLREQTQTCGGSLSLLSSQDDGDLQRELFDTPFKGEPLMRQLKAAFDPAGVLNPGLWWTSGQIQK